MAQRPEKRKRRWVGLVHNGPAFEPAYEPLPKGVHLVYDCRPMQLQPDAEEAATLYAACLNMRNCNIDLTFQANFFADWKKTMTSVEQAKIVDFQRCDFSGICEHLRQIRAERSEAKARWREVQRAKHGKCFVDGIEEDIENFVVEAPIVFVGKSGKHPKRGMLKRRLGPEDVTINCSSDAPIPPAPLGHSWQAIEHNHEVLWIASWRDTVSGERKRMYPARWITATAESDRQKFDKGRRVQRILPALRQRYESWWTSRERRDREMAVVLFMLDKLVLRVGGNTTEDEEEDPLTFGCTTLLCQHVQVDELLSTMTLTFVGKSSVPYERTLEVPRNLVTCVESLKRGKAPKDKLFDIVTDRKINDELRSMDGELTCKVLRTWNASETFERELNCNTTPGADVGQLVQTYKQALIKSAELCNHRRVDGRDGTRSSSRGAVTTTKNNYIDPRIAIAWSKRVNMNVSSIFSTADEHRFQWAMDLVDKDFSFVTGCEGGSQSAAPAAAASDEVYSRFFHQPPTPGAPLAAADLPPLGHDLHPVSVPAATGLATSAAPAADDGADARPASHPPAAAAPRRGLDLRSLQQSVPAAAAAPAAAPAPAAAADDDDDGVCSRFFQDEL